MAGILTNYLKKQRMIQVQPHIRGAVLDLGCADAPILGWIQAERHYIGIDSRPAMVDWLKKHHPQRDFYCRDLDHEPLELPFRFDTILMMAVIEHLEQPAFVLSQLPALLNPDGLVVITTPTPLGNRIHHIGAKLRLFSAEAAGEHKFLFDRNTMRELLDKSGLMLVHYKRFLAGQNQLFVAQAKPG